MSTASGQDRSNRILGIDPGLNVTGYAVIESARHKCSIIEAGVLRSSEGTTKPEMAKRLRVLYDGLVEIIEQLKPSVVVVEQLYSHYAHPRTAILMGHARGVIYLAGAKNDLPVVSYAATRIKKTITGGGRASKEQMQMAMLREFGLTTLPEPPDVADALAIALCHYYAVRNAEPEAPARESA